MPIFFANPEGYHNGHSKQYTEFIVKHNNNNNKQKFIHRLMAKMEFKILGGSKFQLPPSKATHANIKGFVIGSNIRHT